MRMERPIIRDERENRSRGPIDEKLSMFIWET